MTVPSSFLKAVLISEILLFRKRSTGSKAAAPPITFRDVAGVDSAKEELREVVACLRDAGRYARLNAKMPSGVLLTGAPGTGKTLLGASLAVQLFRPVSVSAWSRQTLFLNVGIGWNRCLQR